MGQYFPYDFKVDDLCRYISLGNYKRVLIQLPEGVKSQAPRIAREIESRCKAEVIISGDPNWGACDIPVHEARRVGASLIVHYGHYPYSYHPVQRDEGVEVLYIPMEYSEQLPVEVVDNITALLMGRGLRAPAVVSTAQHLREAKRLVGELRSRGIGAQLPEAYGTPPGLIIGCDYRAVAGTVASASIDSVVIIAGGLFHALGAALSTDKPVIQVDPYRREVKPLDGLREEWLKKRYGVIYRALSAVSWGIWVGALYGQMRFDLARRLASAIEKRGGRYFLFYSRYVTPREILSVDSDDIDAHVVTSCPRVPIDDFTFTDYNKPVLTPGEAMMVLSNKLEPYRFPW